MRLSIVVNAYFSPADCLAMVRQTSGATRHARLDFPESGNTVHISVCELRALGDPGPV
jgi:hypothetical protein